MTVLPRSPVAAARRQLLVDRLAELLEAWGDRNAAGHARELFDVVHELGYALPPALDDHVPPPAASTKEGRAAARRLYEDTRAAKEAQR